MGRAGLARQAARGGVWAALSSYWTIGFGFLATIALTRMLSPEVFGNYALAMFFVQVLRIQPRLGVGFAYVQEQSDSSAVMSTYVGLELILIVLGIVLTLVVLPIMLFLQYAPELAAAVLVLSLAMAIEGLAGIGATLLEKRMLFAPTSLVLSVVFPLSYLPALLMAAAGAGIWSLVVQPLVYNALSLAGLVFALRKWLPGARLERRQFSRTLAKDYLRFGSTVGLGSLAGTLVTQLDNLMVGTIAGTTALGFYDRAYRTAEWPAKLLNSMIARAGFNTFAKLQNDIAGLQRAVSLTIWLELTAALPVAVVVFASGRDLVLLLYGERWLPSALLLQLLIVYAVLRPLWDTASFLFIALGAPRLFTTFTVIQVVTLVAVGLPFTILWGTNGMCVAVGICFTVGIVLGFRRSQDLVHLRLAELFLAPLAAAAVAVAGHFLLLSAIDSQGDLILRLVLRSSLMLVLFGGVLLLLQGKLLIQRVHYLTALISARSGR